MAHRHAGRIGALFASRSRQPGFGTFLFYSTFFFLDPEASPVARPREDLQTFTSLIRRWAEGERTIGRTSRGNGWVRMGLLAPIPETGLCLLLSDPLTGLSRPSAVAVLTRTTGTGESLNVSSTEVNRRRATRYTSTAAEHGNPLAPVRSSLCCAGIDRCGMYMSRHRIEPSRRSLRNRWAQRAGPAVAATSWAAGADASHQASIRRIRPSSVHSASLAM